MPLLGWVAAREWLSSLPKRRNVSSEEVYAWLDENAERLAREIANVPRRVVNEYLQKQHKIFRRQEEGEEPEILDPPMPRFKQSGKWKPVWEWLESLDGNTAIASKEIGEWLAENPRVSEELEAHHSRHNLFKYIQKCYYIVMKKKRKQAQTVANFMARREKEIVHTPPSPTITTPGTTPTTTTTSRKRLNEHNSRMHTDTLPSEHGEILAFPADDDEENQLWTMDKELVKRRYEMLCLLQIRLEDIISNAKGNMRSGSERRRLRHSSGSGSRHRVRHRRKTSSDSYDSDSAEDRIKRQRVDPPVVAWAYTQTGSSDGQEDSSASTLNLIFDRQAGHYWGSTGSGFSSLGNCPRKWSSIFQGWNSLEKQTKTPAIRLQENYYASWMPTWSAYSSNVAVTQRQDQGVQKILDIRFNPSGIPQLVCGCNAAPNELLMYDLETGKSMPLAGHNCQVQAVEYASEGNMIVSCANTTIKVWDSATAACLYTFGPGTNEENSRGHKKKIAAMAVNASQTCLVATSGGQGDCQLLLWNVSTGSLVADLNQSLRQERDIPSMDALEFCNGNLLICGSDSSYGGPSVVQAWDIDALKPLATFPANATYITCLRTNPEGTILVTGSGDGTIGLFDIRTYGGFARLPLGPNCEVTSVSFSSCGRYIQASSTANNSIVWDTRIMPMEFGPKPDEYPPALANSNSRSTRPLHCLSHGKPMPTAENTSQRSGFVDVGDQGVNDARWFSNEPVLVTASGNGSIALWDVSLGEPCLRHIQSHTRCINTVAVSPNDDYICSGGDDQKLVLYENVTTRPTSQKWRLTHPLSER